MTIIAGFSKDGCPILIGDILLSTEDDSEIEIVLPTIGRISKDYLSNAKRKPVGLCQKINLLSPKLAIAWAGSMNHAKSFMQKVFENGLNTKPSYEGLQEAFNRIKENEKIAIIGIYRDGKEIRMFDFNARPVNFPEGEFRYFRARGSGYEALVAIVGTYRENITSGQPNKLDRGIATAVNFNMSLLSQEIITRVPLEKAYGAGYEILHPLGNGLSKFNDLTYLFWKAEEETKGQWKLQSFPFLGANYSYYGDILVIRNVRVSPDLKSLSCKIDNDELHFISPIHRAIRNEELIGYTPTSLNSKYICNTFLWKSHSGSAGAFATFGCYGTQSAPVIWRNEFSNNGGIDINMHFVKESILKIALMASENSENK